MTGAALIDLLTAADYEPRSYSGRSMYGSRCVAVDSGPHGDDVRMADVISDAMLAAVSAAFGTVTADNVDDAVFTAQKLIDAIAGALRGAREDSLGRGSIIYWPNVAWPDDREDD